MASTSRSRKGKVPVTSVAVEFPCGPCKADSRNQEALGFCQFCKHYLCKSCYSYHQNLGKVHILLGRDDMPRQTPTPISNSDPLVESCRDHKHKTIELYCKSHDEVCCVICTTGKHKQCDCFYIPEYTDTLTESPTEECALILQLIQTLIGQFETVKLGAATILKDLDRQKREFSIAVKKYRKEIDSALDQLEKQVVSGMKQVVEINTNDLNYNINRCEESIKALNGTFIDTEMAMESSGKNRVFTLTKTSSKLLQEGNDVLKAVHNNSINVEIKFDENFEILKGIRRIKTFGKVSVKKEPMKFKMEQQQNDKTIQENGQDCKRKSTKSSVNKE